MNRFNALNFVSNEVKKLYPEARVINSGRYLTITGLPDEVDGETPLDKIDSITDMDEMGEAEAMQSDAPAENMVRIGYDLP